MAIFHYTDFTLIPLFTENSSYTGIAFQSMVRAKLVTLLFQLSEIETKTCFYISHRF